MDKNELYFSVKDQLLDEQISLDNLSLPILSDFVKQVSDFIKGGEQIDMSSLKVAIRRGSLAIAVPNTEAIASAVSDYRTFRETGDLGKISPIRARVIADLQDRIQKNPNRAYSISDDISATHTDNAVVISSDTNYKVVDKDQWVQTEAYLYGHIQDLGGKSKPNVHITLSNGNTMTLDAKADVLGGEQENHLYKDRLVKVSAERNLSNKKLRNEKFLSFEHYDPHFDEKEFDEVAAKVKKAWADVPDIVKWVEDVRGNYATAS
jgi:hypothetical protein